MDLKCLPLVKTHIFINIYAYSSIYMHIGCNVFFEIFEISFFALDHKLCDDIFGLPFLSCDVAMYCHY